MGSLSIIKTCDETYVIIGLFNEVLQLMEKRIPGIFSDFA